MKFSTDPNTFLEEVTVYCSNGREGAAYAEATDVLSIEGVPSDLEDDDSKTKEYPTRTLRKSKQSRQQELTTGKGDTKSFSEENVCDECLKLDLPGIFRECHAFRFIYSRPCIAKVGSRSRYAFKTACAVCQMLVASIVEPEEPNEVKEGGNVERYAIIATIYLDWAELDRMTGPRQESKDVCLALVPDTFGAETQTRCYLRTQDLNRHIQTLGGPVLLHNPMDPQPLSPQMVPPLFHLDTAKAWLNCCAEHHQSLCGSGTEPVCAIQLIDCTTHSIVRGEPGVLYVALSYVWAKTKSACGPIRTADGRKRLPEKLSSVVQDAIEVTKALGYRYLWIDKFCIDQDDAGLKHEQIQQMGTIYQNAELTIIAAAGMDETHGLPGVGGKARPCQQILRHQGVTVIWARRDPQSLIASSHWSTRGWTFQEAILSRRRLVFTEDQVYFECRNTHCFESIYYPLDPKIHRYLRPGMFGKNRRTPFGPRNTPKILLSEAFSRYLCNVEDYTHRNLSLDEDSLNAFIGVLEQFLQKWCSFRHVWGVAFPETFDTAKERAYLVHALTWRHDTRLRKPRRRNMFPSWSWVGWEGNVTYCVLWEGPRLLFTNALRDVRFADVAGCSNDDITNIGHDSPRSTSRVLLIEGYVMPIECVTYKLIRDSEYPDCHWEINGKAAELSWSKDSEPDIEVLDKLRDTTRWQCIHLGSVRESAFVMVVELCPGLRTWQRVGMFHVMAYAHRILKGELKTFEIT
ncbi:Vegetative incompatibility protein HET-E-1 [Apiospora arundinis]|uniref:Vegetative incompatibility protein HET-E-1 n=1 Tax=Apiospora arundinis TaxID=335852 RepID=A0ABR2I9Q6_9PEZI